MAGAETIRLFLCGDVMTGRGIDQILPHPAPPQLFEDFVRSAVDYVRIAERRHGRIPRAADWTYVWGAALEEFARMRPDARIANLETAVTLSEDAADKGINYRMNPANVEVLSAAGLDVCTLANNHVLDWGRAGLRETLQTLSDAGIASCGAGLDGEQAAHPAAVALGNGKRLLVFGFAHPSSGVPRDWAAADGRPGVNLLPDLTDATAESTLAAISAKQRPGDIAVASIHWGGNWGHDVPEEQSRFARRLIDGGVSVVHGHSSHHAKAVERYGDGLILYGAGDFLNDYEGIGGHEGYRDDLTLMIWADIEADSGALRGCTMTPLRLRNMRLVAPSESEARWLAETLDRESRKSGTRVTLNAEGQLQATPAK